MDTLPTMKALLDLVLPLESESEGGQPVGDLPTGVPVASIHASGEAVTGPQPSATET